MFSAFFIPEFVFNVIKKYGLLLLLSRIHRRLRCANYCYYRIRYFLFDDGFELTPFIIYVYDFITKDKNVSYGNGIFLSNTIFFKKRATYSLPT